MAVNESKKCLFCNSVEDNPPDYGDLIVNGDLVVHYFCLLLSPALYTREDEENGLFGFVLADILKEEKRIRAQRCVYCGKAHANLSCSISKCRHSFHLECGLKNGCLYEFTENYVTFCENHVKLRREKYNESELCAICYESMGACNQTNSVFVNCCKSSWYHRECLAKFAYSSGYFFKCPLCKDENNFKKMVAKQGIFCPQRDAAWELEPGAFTEQLERPNECSAMICLCRKGRKYDAQDGPWNIVYCVSCGGKAIHNQCLPREHTHFYCDICTELGAEKLVKKCLNEEDSDVHESHELDEESKVLATQMKKCVVKIETIYSFYRACELYKKYYPLAKNKWLLLKKLRVPRKKSRYATDSSRAESSKANTLEVQVKADNAINISTNSVTEFSLNIPSSSKTETNDLDASSTTSKRKLIFNENDDELHKAKKLKLESNSVKTQVLITSFLSPKKPESSPESDRENKTVCPDFIQKKYRKCINQKTSLDKRQPLIHSFFNRLTDRA